MHLFKEAKDENIFFGVVFGVLGMVLWFLVRNAGHRDYKIGETAVFKYTYEGREYDYILRFDQDTINWTLVDLTREISRPMVSLHRETHHTGIGVRADEVQYVADLLTPVRTLRRLSHLRFYVAKGANERSTFATWVT